MINGPATRALQVYEVQEVDGTVQIRGSRASASGAALNAFFGAATAGTTSSARA